MWRYLVGAVAALLLAAAGIFLFRGTAATEPHLPVQAEAAPAVEHGEEAAEAVPVPRAAARTREQKRFDRYDKDRDDRVTRDEYLASRRKAFAKLDTNGDGKLSFDEWAIRTTTKFAGADKDKSGALSRSEFATTAPKPRAKAAPKCSCPPAATHAPDED
ncbi:MAG: EF-hand domain-containing protein [Pseudomonadota bacterium]